MGITRRKMRAGQIAYFDGATYETVLPLAPRYLFDDFEGATYNTLLWLYADNNEAAQGLNGVGQAVFTITNDNTQQDSGIVAAGNALAWDISKGLIFEARLALTTLLPAGKTEVHIGVLGQTQADGQLVAEADTYDEHALFVFDGNGIPLIYTDDGTHDNNAVVTTGVAVTLAQYNIFRIDFTDYTDVKFYLNGVGVGTGTTFGLNHIASPLVQPYVNMVKTDGINGIQTVTLDSIKVWQATR